MLASVPGYIGPQFISSYQGGHDYRWRGVRFSVRSHAADWKPGEWNYSPEEYAIQRVAFVGTIHDWGIGEFPPAELELFFPGFVRARWDNDSHAVVYADGQLPDVVRHPQLGTVAKATV